jgi:hypothetical protein
LCSIIAFYTDDPAQIERLFNKSALANRAKWTERPDYRERTIAFALASQTELYTPPEPFDTFFLGSKAERNGQSREKGRGMAPASDSATQVGTEGEPLGSEPPEDGGPLPDEPREGPTDPDSQPEQRQKSGYQTILDYYRLYYDPVFKRGTVLHSRTLGRQVKMGEAISGAPAELLVQLAEAFDAPRERKGRLDRDALPRFFANWCKSAWVDLIRPLPEEEVCPEISDSAQEEFRARMKAAMHTLVSIGERTYENNKEVTHVERRSLIDWCSRWARPGRWDSIRGHTLWVRREPIRDAGERLAIALRVELFHQIHFRPFASLTQNKFGRLAALYGVGEDRANRKVNGVRATILTLEFIDELLSQPDSD